MPRLKIRFEQMFLLVRTADQPVVLMPKGSGNMTHDLYVLGTKNDIRICGADVSLCKATSPPTDDTCAPLATSTTTVWPDSGWVLNISELANPRPTVKPAYLNFDKLPADLNGRIRLPPGEFGWTWNMSDFGEARWTVHATKWNVHQWLTDILTFECDISNTGCHYLRIAVPGDSAKYVKLQHAAGDDIDLIFLNKDRSHGEPTFPFGQRTWKLEDFRLIYSLFDSETLIPVPEYYGPSPVTSRPPGKLTPRRIRPNPIRFGNCDNAPLDTGGILSDTDPERPICGGGQGDPP